MLDPILMKQFQMMNGKRLVNLGNNTVEVHDLFRLYLITSLPNPHYTP
jgi:dynein heavy chain